MKKVFLTLILLELIPRLMFAGSAFTGGGGSGSGIVSSGLKGQMPYYALDGTVLTATSTVVTGNGYVTINNPINTMGRSSNPSLNLLGGSDGGYNTNMTYGPLSWGNTTYPLLGVLGGDSGVAGTNMGPMGMIGLYGADNLNGGILGEYAIYDRAVAGFGEALNLSGRWDGSNYTWTFGNLINRTLVQIKDGSPQLSVDGDFTASNNITGNQLIISSIRFPDGTIQVSSPSASSVNSIQNLDILGTVQEASATIRALRVSQGGSDGLHAPAEFRSVEFNYPNSGGPTLDLYNTLAASTQNATTISFDAKNNFGQEYYGQIKAESPLVGATSGQCGRMKIMPLVLTTGYPFTGSADFTVDGCSATSTLDGTLVVTNSTNTRVSLTVKGASTQISDIQDWTNSSSVILSSMDKSGNLYVPLIKASSSTISGNENVTGTGQFLGGIIGDVSGVSASTSNFGGYISTSADNTVAVASPGTGQWFDVVSTTLAPGDWLVSITEGFSESGVTFTANPSGGLGTSSGNNSANLHFGTTAAQTVAPLATGDTSIGIANIHVVISSLTTYYLKANETYSVGTPKAYGSIYVVRNAH